MTSDASVLIRTVVRVGATCGEDEAFRQATKFWTGALRLGIDTHSVSFNFDSGDLISVIEVEGSVEESAGQFGFDAPSAVWRTILEGVDGSNNSEVVGFGEALVRTGDRDAYWRYYPAVRRLFELLKEHLR
ncbi:MAG: hypothetical protein VX743_09595 [Actinomycetota bacterium]|nr:hypothetical protein [Actinomycetota bacterium]